VDRLASSPLASRSQNTLQAMDGRPVPRHRIEISGNEPLASAPGGLLVACALAAGEQRNIRPRLRGARVIYMRVRAKKARSRPGRPRARRRRRGLGPHRGG